MPVPMPTEAQMQHSMQAALLGTLYHSLVVVGLNGLRGDWHRARAAGDFAGMVAAEARAAWVLAHARSSLEATDETPAVVEAYLTAALWRADGQGHRYRLPPWRELRAAMERHAPCPAV